MTIHVICPGCLKRFEVSDQFAGRKGPCPKCKALIEIPASEDVKIHAPDGFGPKDSKGRAVLKPVFRQETKITAATIVIIVMSIVLCLVAAIVFRAQLPQQEEFPWWPLVLGALVLSFPLVFSGYTFLRDQELAPHRGQELWLRVAICGLLYAALWLCFPVALLAFREYDPICVGVAVAAMIGLGGGVAAMVLEMDYLLGLVHFGMYFTVCVLLRWISSGAALPFAG